MKTIVKGRPVKRRGFTLVEILIAAVIMAITGGAVLTIFSQSTNTLRRADARREFRFYLREILAHVNRQSLHKLFYHYAPSEARAASPDLNSRLLGSLAVYDEKGVMENPVDEMSNPLGFTQAFVTQMVQEKLRAQIEFNFLAREDDLKVDETGKPDKQVGILHMQAGTVHIALYQTIEYDDGTQDEELVAEIDQPIMCPAIVGRPGLKLSSCPAINQRVKCAYLPILAQVEGFAMPAKEEASCSTPDMQVTPAQVTLEENT